MAMTIKELESQLSGLQTYTPETEDALRQRAENIYNPQYQQDLQSIRDSLQQGINQQNRNMISAGMQRSSYGQSAIAALRGQGLKAEAQLGAQRDANIANLLYQLMEGEKDRKLNADQNRDNLLLQLYQLANKGSGKPAPEPQKDGNALDKYLEWLSSGKEKLTNFFQDYKNGTQMKSFLQNSLSAAQNLAAQIREKGADIEAEQRKRLNRQNALPESWVNAGKNNNAGAGK